jgi:hypothetical protein
MKSRKADNGRASRNDADTRDYSHLSARHAFSPKKSASSPTTIQRSWDRAMQSVTPRGGRQGKAGS